MPLQRNILILLALEHRDQYGLEIQQTVSNMKSGKSITIGGLYQTLKKMERKGLLKSRWGSDSGHVMARRRYYKLTAIGRKELENLRNILKPD